MRRGRALWVGLVVASATLTVPAGALAAGTVLLNDTFANATTGSPVVAEPNGHTTTPTAGLPCLTAGPTATGTPAPGCGLGSGADKAGSGVMRLTTTTGSQESTLVYNGTFPTSAGLDVTYDQYQYDGGADGMSFALSVAPPLPGLGGGAGGALGYAPNSTVAPGLPGGYLGIGFDVFGNYSNTQTDGTGCSDPAWASTGTGHDGNQVVVRGPGNGTAGYCLITGTQTIDNDPMNQFSLLSSGTTRSGAARGIHIRITPGGTWSVAIDPSGGTSYTPILSGDLPSSYINPATGQTVKGLPPRLTFAFSGATGGVAGIQEISNVVATTVNPAPPTLTLVSSDTSGHRVTAGGTILYTLTGGVAASSATGEAEPVTVTDPLPAGETLAGTPVGTGWNCAASTSTNVSCTSRTPVAIGASLPTLDVAANVPVSSPASVTNTATITSSDAAGPVSAGDAVTVTPQSLGGGTRAATAGAVTCAPNQLLLGEDSTCTDVVTGTAGSTVSPSGTVLFSSPSGVFASPGHCTLTAVAGHPGSAACSITYTPKQPGTTTITAGYQGDSLHLADTATTTVASAPVAGKTATVAILSGTILIKLRHGNLFEPLSASGAISIPIGSIVDALDGTVSMTTAADTLSPTNENHDADDGAFSEGLFAVKQAAEAAQGTPPPVDLVLQTPVGAVAKARCTRRGPTGKGIVRSLKGVVKGNYVAVGAANSLSMRQGTFVEQDRCDGTLSKVIKGKATVRYRVRGGHGRRAHTVTRTLHAGQQLLTKERFLADQLAAG
ncbi:MAG TPA: hypothetical protein VMF14_20980 [Solirubrobacteraceae bacterium]|nr:hypothetical protein [Solirubrobacteraceae bacterium]